MSHATTTSDSNGDSEPREPLPPLPTWKWLLLLIALLFGISGAILHWLAPEPPPEPLPLTPLSSERPTLHNPLLPYSLLPSVQSFQGPATHSFIGPLGESGEGLQEIRQFAEEQLGMVEWSAFLMKLGFSFLVGFSIGYALAGFLRLTLFLFGAILLLLFGLQYAGLIEVNWIGMEQLYDRFIEWLAPHIGSFRDFITSNLSSSGMAAIGLTIGIKR